MGFDSVGEIENALRRVGELLDASGHAYAIVIVGGAALDLLEITDRSTRDVDILAFAELPSHKNEVATLRAPPSDLPEALARAIHTVARDLKLDADWLNADVALQWRTGLPPNLVKRLHWRKYGSLSVGLVDRYDLILFKLFAAADSGTPKSRHYQDLLALGPSSEELDNAAAWVETQDAAEAFAEILKQVTAHARSDLRL